MGSEPGVVCRKHWASNQHGRTNTAVRKNGSSWGPGRRSMSVGDNQFSRACTAGRGSGGMHERGSSVCDRQVDARRSPIVYERKMFANTSKTQRTSTGCVDGRVRGVTLGSLHGRGEVSVVGAECGSTKLVAGLRREEIQSQIRVCVWSNAGREQRRAKGGLLGRAGAAQGPLQLPRAPKQSDGTIDIIIRSTSEPNCHRGG